MNLQSMSPKELLEVRGEVWNEYFEQVFVGTSTQVKILAKKLDEIDNIFKAEIWVK